jgi:hypothetical protein
VYEEKVDGWRIVAYKDSDRVQLVKPPRRLTNQAVRGPKLDAALRQTASVRSRRAA